MGGSSKPKAAPPPPPMARERAPEYTGRQATRFITDQIARRRGRSSTILSENIGMGSTMTGTKALLGE